MDIQGWVNDREGGGMTKGRHRGHRVVVVRFFQNYHNSGAGVVGFVRVFPGDWESRITLHRIVEGATIKGVQG